METNEKKIASKEYVANAVGKLMIAFQETTKDLFQLLMESILKIGFTEDEVTEMVEETIYTVKKSKITIADVINGAYTKKKDSNVSI